MTTEYLEKRVWEVMCSFDDKDLSALDFMTVRYLLRDRLVGLVQAEIKREVERRLNTGPGNRLLTSTESKPISDEEHLDAARAVWAKDATQTEEEAMRKR